MKKLEYRPEIDGLRAVAVLLVIIYHFKFTFLGNYIFPGGFIGVDVFFVISGYLITKIIMLEIKNSGKFNILHFFERRARRILPALMVILFVSLICAWFFYPANEFINLAYAVISSIYFFSNYWFYYINDPYFAIGYDMFKPLLHSWSLSVEEQFYIFYALVFFIFIRFLKNKYIFLILITTLFLSSFIHMFNPEIFSYELMFYTTLNRIWEMMVGAYIAFYEIERGKIKNKILSYVAPIIGIVMIIYAARYFYPGLTPHPSHLTLIPTIGAGLIIMFSSKEDLIGRIFGSKIFVKIGLLSYSIYLWHHIIYFFSLNFSSNESFVAKAVISILTFLLSIITFHIIEKPFRNKQLIATKTFLITIISTIIFLTLCSFIVIKFNGFNERNAHKNLYLIDHYQNKYLDLYFENYVSLENNNKKNILIIGNSIARDLYLTLLLSKYKDKYNFYVPVPNSKSDKDKYQLECFYNFLKNNDTTCSSEFSKENYSKSLHNYMEIADVVMIATHSYRFYDKEKIKEIINMLKDRNIKTILVGQSLDLKVLLNEVKDYVNKNKRPPSKAELAIFEKNAFAQIRHTEKKNITLKNIAEEENIVYLDRVDFQCFYKEKKCKLMGDEVLYIFDTFHYTYDGGFYFAKRIDEINWLDIDHIFDDEEEK